MRKITVFLMSIVFMAFMGLTVFATSDEPKPVDGTTPIVTDPIEIAPVDPLPIDGGEVLPCPKDAEVCAMTTGETGTGVVTEVKVCSIDEKGNEICTLETVVIDGTEPGTVDGEVPADCVTDPTVCQRTDVIYTMAPADGKYEDGIYYMTGSKDLSATAGNTDMVTVSVVASTLGLIALGVAANKKLRKH